MKKRPPKGETPLNKQTKLQKKFTLEDLLLKRQSLYLL
jgi:hypothetical protein